MQSSWILYNWDSKTWKTLFENGRTKSHESMDARDLCPGSAPFRVDQSKVFLRANGYPAETYLETVYCILLYVN